MESQFVIIYTLFAESARGKRGNSSSFSAKGLRGGGRGFFLKIFLTFL
jgi:hypothetical protein